jgi:hypothetical protein
MMPSATVLGPARELVTSETLRPMMPASPTPRSNVCASRIVVAEDSLSNEKEKKGFCSEIGVVGALRSPSRLRSLVRVLGHSLTE